MVRDDVQVACGIGVVAIQSRRDPTAIDGERADHRFHGAGRAEGMGGVGLCSAHGNSLRVSAEDLPDRRGLTTVVHLRRARVRIDVIDLRRIDLGISLPKLPALDLLLDLGLLGFDLRVRLGFGLVLLPALGPLLGLRLPQLLSLGLLWSFGLVLLLDLSLMLRSLNLALLLGLSLSYLPGLGLLLNLGLVLLSFDPLLLLAGGDELERQTRHILDCFADRPHVFNLGHGIGQTTPVEHVDQLVGVVRGWRP